MRKKMLFVCLIFTTCLNALAATSGKIWYVSGEGNDANSGALASPFRSLQKAADVVQPGDTVLIGNGIYTSSNLASDGAVLSIKTSGTPAAWITWKAKHGQYPELRPVGWAGVRIAASYQVIDGLRVIGGSDSIYLSEALEDAKKPVANPRYNTNGIFVTGRGEDASEKPHNVTIRNCIVGKCPGGGITAIQADYITIEDCKVYENCWYMRYAGSGITTLDGWAFDDKPGYHTIIRRNMVWNNKTMVPWEKIGKLSDGNGILLDVTDQEEGATNPNADTVIGVKHIKQTSVSAKTGRPKWLGRSLIANNLSVYNGGSGIHCFRTSRVDIINNTTYWNGQTVGYQEIFSNHCDDVVMMNNVMIPKPGNKVTSNNHNTNIKWDYNVYPEAQSFFKGEHDIVADPKFIDARVNVAEANFMLAKNSPALNSGTTENIQPISLNDKKRPQGKGIDRGCYEQ